MKKQDMRNKGKEHMPTEKKYEINELTDTESTADAGNMLNGKAVVDEPTVTEFTEIESMGRDNKTVRRL